HKAGGDGGGSKEATTRPISTLPERAIMTLVSRAGAGANYADNAAPSPETNIVCSLNTADPGDAGFANTSEAAYTSYARTNVARTTGGWSLLGSAGSPEQPGVGSPPPNIDLPAGPAGGANGACLPPRNAGGETVTFFTTGKSGGGASAILWSGSVSPSIATGNGITPRLTTATTITLD